MFPIIGSLISAGSNLLGSMFSADQSAKNTQAQIQGQERLQTESEAYNAQQAEINREFQAQQSSTAFQRARADMQAAGLNPILAAGAQSSTPTGSVASVSTQSMPTPQTQSKMAGFGHAVSAGLDAMVTAKTLDKMTEEIAKLKTAQNVDTATAALEAARKIQSGAETKTEGERANTEHWRGVTEMNESALRALKLPGARVSAKESEGVEKNLGKWLEGTGAVKYGAGAVGDIIAPITSTAKDIIRMRWPFGW